MWQTHLDFSPAAIWYPFSLVSPHNLARLMTDLVTPDPSERLFPINAQAARGALCSHGRRFKHVQGRVQPTENNLQLGLA